MHVRVAHQPRVNHLPLETPLVPYLEGGKFFLGNQSVDGKFIDLQVLGHLTNS